MLKRSLIMFGVVLSFTVSSFAQKTSAEVELRAIYKKIDLGLRTRDVNKVTQYLDLNYTLESDGKKMNRVEAIGQWREIMGFIKSVAKLSTKIEKITVDGSVYIVDYSQTSSGKIQFPQSPVLPFTFNGKITDRWRREKNGKWQTIASVEHLSDLKVNGESAKPPTN